ncbi:MAG: hypothetical protein BroJett040_22520 [Oligoflexia bacterium]|nr:MAG: hypothetical protein BroJett040_22520 [Oligoflexia bacterium]
MENSQSNKILFWGVVTAVVVASVWAKLNFSRDTHVKDLTNYSYEMPRPKEYGSDFDLNGREIDRQVLRNEEIAKQKAAEAKKDDKKKQADAQKKKATKTAAKSSSQKKGSLSVDVIEGDQSTMTGFDNRFSDSQVPTYTTLNETKKSDAKKSTDDEENDSDFKLTKQQWRNALQAHPNSSMASNFLKAHLKGYLKDEDFYEVTFELLQDQNEERKKIGLYILTQDQDPQAFIYLSKYYSKLSETLRTQVWKIMLTYAQPQKLSRLQAALQSKDKAAITLALQVLDYAVKETKDVVALQQGTISQGRGVAGQTNPQAFSIFVTTLKYLSSQGDFSSHAQGLLTDIQGLLKV